MGQAEDEIRIDAEDALHAIEGLEVRRMFSGWGFYQRGLLSAAAWEGEFRFRTRQGRHWVYEVVDRELLGRPDEFVDAARRSSPGSRRNPPPLGTANADRGQCIAGGTGTWAWPGMTSAFRHGDVAGSAGRLHGLRQRRCG